MRCDARIPAIRGGNGILHKSGLQTHRKTGKNRECSACFCGRCVGVSL